MLKETIQINHLTLRNRIVMPPMATGKADHGAPDSDLVAYYAARAEGTGLIIVEHAYVSPEGMAHNNQLSMADDTVVDAYRKLTDAVHAKGAAVFAQINHAGAHARDTGLPAISPSEISIWEGDQAQEVMTEDDVERVTEKFVSAALRVKAAGFDVHARRSRQNKYYLENSSFELPELKILIDAVESSKFITEKKSRLLVEKLL